MPCEKIQSRLLVGTERYELLGELEELEKSPIQYGTYHASSHGSSRLVSRSVLLGICTKDT